MKTHSQIHHPHLVDSINKSSRPQVGALLRDERGLSSVEYVILLALLVAGGIGTWNSIGDQVMANLGASQTSFTDNLELNRPGN